MPLQRVARQHLGVAAVSAAACAVVWAVATGTAWGRSLDEQVLARAAGAAGQPGHDPLADLLGFARWAVPLLALVAVVAVCLAAVLRGERWRAPLTAAALPVLCVGASLALRSTLPDPGAASSAGFVGATFPSTHVSAAAGACLAVWWLRPPRWPRDITATILAGTVLVAVLANVAVHAHRPSDTAGSVLLVVAVGALAAALMPRPRAASRSWSPPAGPTAA